MRINITAQLICAAIATAFWTAPAGAHAAQRPNIILILADDLGFSDIGCYGSEIPTPNLDKLAAGGVRFREFYNTARCCPSRASLLTGLYAHQAGIGHMMGGPDKYIGYADGLTSDCVTLAEALGTAGYSTYMSGKWHVTRYTGANAPNKSNWPLQRGFNKFYGTVNGFGSFWDPATLCRGNTYISPYADPDYKPEEFFYTNAIADNAIAFLDEHRKAGEQNPYFLYLAFTAPHWPMHATEGDIARFKGRYDAGYDPVRMARIKRMIDLGIVPASLVPAPTIGEWDGVKHKQWEARCMEVYAAMVYRMDQEIGKLLENLRGAGDMENTFIMFISDNGACPEDVARFSGAPYNSYQPMKSTDLQHAIWPPMQTRDGHPVKTGPDVMPGPDDSFAAYGENWANVSDTPFRLYKHYVHEGGISSPAIFHWPAGIKPDLAGKILDGTGHIIDVMPTFLELAGAKYPTNYKGHQILPAEGKSLLPAIRGAELAREKPLFWEHENNRAARRGKWKIVALDGHPWELYDIKADRGEMHNLAAENPELVKELSSLWDAWAARTRVLPLGAWKEDGTPPEPVPTTNTFTFKPGDRYQRSEGPVIGGKQFQITAKIRQWATDGVIISHGEAKNGYALFAEDGKLNFLLRWKGEYVRLTSDAPLTSGAHTIEAAIGEEGRMTIKVDGKLAGQRRPPGFILHTPVKELSVGSDFNGAVDPKLKRRAFQGKLDCVMLTVIP
jgi:arylsulfatase